MLISTYPLQYQGFSKAVVNYCTEVGTSQVDPWLIWKGFVLRTICAEISRATLTSEYTFKPQIHDAEVTNVTTPKKISIVQTLSVRMSPVAVSSPKSSKQKEESICKVFIVTPKLACNA